MPRCRRQLRIWDLMNSHEWPSGSLILRRIAVIILETVRRGRMPMRQAQWARFEQSSRNSWSSKCLAQAASSSGGRSVVAWSRRPSSASAPEPRRQVMGVAALEPHAQRERGVDQRTTPHDAFRPGASMRYHFGPRERRPPAGVPRGSMLGRRGSEQQGRRAVHRDWRVKGEGVEAGRVDPTPRGAGASGVSGDVLRPRPSMSKVACPMPMACYGTRARSESM